MNVSPSDIEFMIHCLCTSEPHEYNDSPAIIGAIDKFLREDMIVPIEKLVDGELVSPYSYTATDKGAAWVSYLSAKD